MICPICTQELCICVNPSLFSTTPTLPPLTPTQKFPGVTLEEFGGNLSKAIKAASERVQAIKTAHVYAKQGKVRMARLSVLESERLSRDLQSHLISPEIRGEDMRRILALDAQAPLPPDLPSTAGAQNTPPSERIQPTFNDPHSAQASHHVRLDPSLND